MQRSGTTSVGNFFKHFDYPTAGYNVKRSSLWSKYYYNGDFESIFTDKEFLSYQVFEDNPWWSPDFYKVLYHRFPDAKFVLMIRNSDDWFKSMVSHSGGKTLGNTKRHCNIYRREQEFYERLDNDFNFKPLNDIVDNLLTLEGLEEHYKSIYDIHNREVIEFFNDKKNNPLFYCDLYDNRKWQKLGNFLGHDVQDNFDIHSNKSKLIKIS